jgi:hypothetical protein
MFVHCLKVFFCFFGNRDPSSCLFKWIRFVTGTSSRVAVEGFVVTSPPLPPFGIAGPSSFIISSVASSPALAPALASA